MNATALQSAFRSLAAGKFGEGIAELGKDSNWEVEDLSLDEKFYLGFPETPGWGEGLLIASLLKRHATASGKVIDAFAHPDLCDVLADDPTFRVTPVENFDQCLDSGGRSPLAILHHALIGELLNQTFVPINGPAKVADSIEPRVGIAWASLDKSNERIPEKSMPLDVLLDLASLDTSHVVSFQRGITPEDRNRLCFRCGEKCTILSDDTRTHVAEICRLARMITISTTTAHIAASFSVQTDLLAARRDGPQWFWQAQEEHRKTLYPTVSVVLGGQGAEWWRELPVT
jgi:hypothetical protein